MACFSSVSPLLIVLKRYIKAPKGHENYGLAMKLLGVPFVWNCGWRALLPSLYLQRFVFWDTWLNSILVDRTWACIGELACTATLALLLTRFARFSRLVGPLPARALLCDITVSTDLVLGEE